MTNAEPKEFVRAHRTCVFGYKRKNHGPSMSIVYYMVDGDEILISTMAERSKAKAVRRNLKLALCILDEIWPPTDLSETGYSPPMWAPFSATERRMSRIKNTNRQGDRSRKREHVKIGQ